MMLVHKPQNIVLPSPASFTHRRHPSAPVVVQPTRTPGLLSLSKPAKQSPHRQLPSNQRRDVKQSSKTAAGMVRAPVVPLAPTTKPQMGQVVPATPTPSRGRKQAKQAKDKAQAHRSASQSSIRGKHGRQPSPPIEVQAQLQSSELQFSSQAEATVVPPIKSTNPFDPFLDSPPSSPTLSKPSGNLAFRRQQQTPPATPPQSKAIPVPVSQRSKHSEISRSDPITSHMRPRPVPKRSSTYQDFPVCDDLNEPADKSYTLSPPATPRRPVGGNRSLTSTPRVPVSFSDPVTPVRGQRKHHRVPSEGVFNMSSDEEVSSGPGGVVLNPNVQALFASASKRASLPASAYSTPAFARAAMITPMRSRESSPVYGLSKEQLLEQQAQEKAGFFASSMFQNSPSPEELPDPLLL
ncbi:hypothetical protein JR316_0008921 [Psilocybe cubensis]|uniref:Uncharacterized protein n=2 Tax=Psilocybe cubensis TaxID=181762 RepID=A0A8H7XY60_PSICU|nr:hypothetical protein JR316_0008921 [Psilocybe cubensis]KAH9478466.1 hypothetical protein JR316_0008921 [Psilocybe cubensis]